MLLGVLVAPQPAVYAGENLIIGGSGTNLPVIRLLARAFTKAHPDITIDVPPSLGSTGGIRAVAEGAISLGLISRPLRRPEEYMGLTVRRYAKTALVIGVNFDVPDKGISSAELLEIYSGKKTLWKNKKEIIVLLRERGDSSIEVLKAKLPGFSEIYDECERTRRWITLFTDQDMNRTIASTPSAIGLTDGSSIVAERLRIKALRLNGVAPTPQNLHSGKYPLEKTLSFVFRKNKVTAAAMAFMDFVKSREGVRILRENACLPAD